MARIGSCPPGVCQGKCCSFIGAFLISQEQLEFFKMRGVPIVDAAPLGNSAILGYGMVPQTCQHLTDDNLCDIYADRPDICKRWPKEQNDLLGLENHCGYRFV